ncbi:MAG: hypothetical protein CNF01_05140 [Halieaceae bacterium MED-G27]|nr:hypothetical protein [Halieaceae bacterium]OUT66937.1 MAG: hypothetical protein CBB81_02830 [Cellvibrionales bacterium TMED21]PDH37061.1 MAG: hypothetical protein CNF01_05140 [Halieaceae bacterium MED-G27]|tara:strand:+ start:4170 stop:6155 length:1986 start_codon:yes stop_codon:yes gene_type:complete
MMASVKSLTYLLTGRRGSFALAVVIFLLSIFVMRSPLDRFSIDLLHLFTPPFSEGDDVVVIAIDEATLQAVEDPWPWPRQYYGAMLNRLNELGVTAVGFDIQFVDEMSHEGDTYFANAIAHSKRVVLGSDMVERSTEYFTGVIVMEPISQLTEAGAISGSVGLDPDIDGIVREPPDYSPSFFGQLAGSRAVLTQRNKDFIKYRPLGSSLKKISALQLLIEGGVRSEDLTGKFAVIGWDTKAVVDANNGQVDRFRTPLSRFGGGTLAGVEVHATLLRNALRNDWVSSLPPVANMALWLLAISISFLVISVSSISRVALYFFLLQLGSFGLSLGLWSKGLFFNALVITPVLMGMVAYAVVNDLFTVGRQKRELRKAFDQYLSPDMIEKLVEDPEKLKMGGESREMTIMFCDIRGFTSISERFKNEPDKLADIINRLLTALTREILDTGGTVDKYMGDCIMAFWNAPLEQHDHASRAARTALNMMGALERSNEALIAEGLITAPLRVGIGLGTGYVVVGNMGSTQRFDYTVLGDTVNTASRLEGLTKQLGASILLAQPTIDKLTSDLLSHSIELDLVRLKGQQSAVCVHGLFNTPISKEERARIAKFLKSYRSGKFLQARATLEEIRDAAPRFSPYADALSSRLGTQITLPQHQWTGVFDLSTK